MRIHSNEAGINRKRNIEIGRKDYVIVIVIRVLFSLLLSDETSDFQLTVGRPRNICVGYVGLIWFLNLFVVINENLVSSFQFIIFTGVVEETAEETKKLHGTVCI
jgi:hypothetical protein